MEALRSENEVPMVTRFCCPCLLLLFLVGGCTEKDPLYCDGEKPCTQTGYTCDYEHRRCVQKLDASVPDSGQPDSGATDTIQAETGTIDFGLPDQTPGDQGGPDGADISFAE
jgi:hypothetical protein